MQLSQPSTLRSDELDYTICSFIARAGNEDKPDYIFGVVIKPSKSGSVPLLICNEEVIDVAQETRDSILKRFECEAIAGLDAVRVLDRVTVTFEGHGILKAYTEKCAIAKDQESQPLLLPCSKEALLRHFGKPNVVRRDQ